MWRCVDLALTDVSEEHIASIFRAEKYAATCSRWFPAGGFLYHEYGGDTFHSATSQKTTFFEVLFVCLLLVALKTH
jgi:hypothetical protein